MMQNLAGITNETSDEQHKDLGISRRKRDTVDSDILSKYLKQSSPFDGDNLMLRSIATGMSATTACNVDDVKRIGEQIMKSMIGVSVKDFVFRKKDQAVLMTAKSTESGTSVRQLDPSLLFQRLIVIAKKSQADESEIFKYELCGHPSSMFDDSGLLREADKPELSKAIAKACSLECTSSCFQIGCLPGKATHLSYLINLRNPECLVWL